MIESVLTCTMKSLYSGGFRISGGGGQSIIRSKFSKNCMKIEKIVGQDGQVCIPAPRKSASVVCMLSVVTY